VAESLNITYYEHFALRGANSSVDDPFFQLGLLRDNYSPKPRVRSLPPAHRRAGPS
jgi:hypothetical protein